MNKKIRPRLGLPWPDDFLNLKEILAFLIAKQVDYSITSKECSSALFMRSAFTQAANLIDWQSEQVRTTVDDSDPRPTRKKANRCEKARALALRFHRVTFAAALPWLKYPWERCSRNPFRIIVSYFLIPLSKKGIAPALAH